MKEEKEKKKVTGNNEGSEVEKEIEKKTSEDNEKEKEILREEKITVKDVNFIAWVLIGLAITGGIIYSIKFFHKGTPAYEMTTYNGFTILNMSGTYYTQIKIHEKNQSYNIEMRSSPSEVENIPMERGIKDDILNTKEILMTTDPDLGSKTVIGMVEVGKIIGTKYNILDIPTVIGLTSAVESQPDRAVITCANATPDALVIYFERGSETIVYEKDNCIRVQGKTEDDIIKASDKLGYVLMGIINID